MTLELGRTAHEELEVLERAMHIELGDPNCSKMKRVDEIARDQVVSTLLQAHHERSERLVALYEDADDARRDEINSMTGSGVFSTFYEQLRATRDYHRKHQIKPQTELAEKQLLSELLEGADPHNFTGEEAEGKYLDMHELHELFLNLKGVKRFDYSTYLRSSTDLGALPKQTASSPAGLRYLRALKAYWQSFLQRTQPLMPLAKMLSGAESELADAWSKGAVERWQNGQPTSSANGDAGPTVDLESTESAVQLEALGLEKLKQELAHHGLKCGGSLKERAERLFLLKSTPIDKMPKQHLAKGAKRPREAAGGEAADGEAAVAGATPASGAVLEAQLARMGELLAEEIEETAAMVEKKQARTYEEIERDLAQAAEEEVPDAEENEEEEEKPIYNPLNLPLGWDGKPIPYWLYKLHGLNLEFKCEICGNYSYWGPRAYERHFQEWRHAHGMQCLGIPNTKHFHGITLIEDAYTLWAKLKAEQSTLSWNPELDEEFEDKQGNVMNRKTYADLARQGLLD